MDKEGMVKVETLEGGSGGILEREIEAMEW